MSVKAMTVYAVAVATVATAVKLIAVIVTVAVERKVAAAKWEEGILHGFLELLHVLMAFQDQDRIFLSCQ